MPWIGALVIWGFGTSPVYSWLKKTVRVTHTGTEPMTLVYVVDRAGYELLSHRGRCWQKLGVYNVQIEGYFFVFVLKLLENV